MPIATYMGLGAPQQRLVLLSTDGTGFDDSQSTVASVSTAVNLGQDNINAWNLWQAQSSASRIFLPQPVQGMQLWIAFADDAVSSGTKIGPSTALSGFDVVTTGGTTGAYGRFTTEEGGHVVYCVAVTDNRWALYPWGSVALTAASSG